MENNISACSNCRCLLNYECVRFKLFFDGKYIDVNEYSHNNDYTCEHKIEEEIEKSIQESSSLL